MKLGMQIGLGTGGVRWRPLSPTQKGGGAPQKNLFGPCLLWPQAAGWIKMALGMEVGVSPGDYVLDGDPAPLPKKVAEPPQFLAHVYCG